MRNLIITSTLAAIAAAALMLPTRTSPTPMVTIKMAQALPAEWIIKGAVVVDGVPNGRHFTYASPTGEPIFFNNEADCAAVLATDEFMAAIQSLNIISKGHFGESAEVKVSCVQDKN